MTSPAKKILFAFEIVMVAVFIIISFLLLRDKTSFDNISTVKLSPLQENTESRFQAKNRQHSNSSSRRIDKDNNKDKDNNNISKKTMKHPEATVNLPKSSSIDDYITLKFFRHLETIKGKTNDENSQIQAIQNYLLSKLDADTTQKIIEYIKIYRRCEGEVSRELWINGVPRTSEARLARLSKIQDYRRACMGEYLATKLFADETKKEEYRIRRQAIIDDTSLYGAEKERRLSLLNLDMWGDKAKGTSDFTDHTGADPFKLYQEKLLLYKKDMDEMEPSEKKAFIRSLREQFFTQDVVAAMEKKDEAEQDQKAKERLYDARSREILSDNSISNEEKQKKLRELQEQIFGGHAEAFRRMEAMRKAREQMMQQQ